MNVVVLVGRLTRDPEMRVAGSTNVCRFSIAVNRNYKKEGQPDADFFNCSAFGKTGETIGKYLTKGRQIAIRGQVQNYSYQGQDGTKKTGTSIVVDQFDFIGSKSDGVQKQGGSSSGMEIDDDFSLLADDDDVPF